MSSFTVTTTLSERLGCAPAPAEAALPDSKGPDTWADANPMGAPTRALKVRAAILVNERI